MAYLGPLQVHGPGPWFQGHRPVCRAERGCGRLRCPDLLRYETEGEWRYQAALLLQVQHAEFA